MKRTLLLVSLALTLMSAACRPLDVPATPTVALPSETPSAVPPTETPEPTAVPTETPTPEVWEIWFYGFSCEQASHCLPALGVESKFYSIMSDGTGLRQLEITEFPPLTLALPENAPRPTHKEFLMSPDNTKVLYRSELGALYNVNMADGEAIVLYTPTQGKGLGPYCWAPDGLSIKFLIFTDGFSALFSVNLIGEELQQVVDYQVDNQEVKLINFGVCSPDYQEMAVSVRADKPPESGLFVINMNSGQPHQILPNFSVSVVRVAPKP